MKSIYPAGVCAAVVIAFSAAAFAQATPSNQTPSTATSATQQRTSADQTVTVAGCIQRETDYRRARDAGRGGVAGTGVGAANEFVLLNASSTAAGTGTAGTTGSTPGAATGTAGTTATSMAYELTGANEPQAAQHVGRRVEIRKAQGRRSGFDRAADGRSDCRQTA